MRAGEAHPCLRLQRCVTPSECDLELVDWRGDAACARCPYNPLLDVVEEEPP